MLQYMGFGQLKHQTYSHHKSIYTNGCKIQNVQKFAQYSIKQTCISVCKNLHNFAYMQNCYSNRAYMQNCYSNYAYMHDYCRFVNDFFSLSSLPGLVRLSLTLSSISRRRRRPPQHPPNITTNHHPTTINHPQHPPTITTNQPPPLPPPQPTHYNINLIQTQSTQN